MQKLQEAYLQLQKEIGTNVDSWPKSGHLSDSQSRALILFSKTLATTEHAPAIQKYWHRICFACVQDQVKPEAKFVKSFERIQKLLTEKIAPPVLKKSHCEEIFAFLSHEKYVVLTLPDCTLPSWIAPAKEMLERVMKGVYGVWLKQEILQKYSKLDVGQLKKYTCIDLLLQRKDPVSFGFKQPYPQIHVLVQRLVERCGLSQENANAICMKMITVAEDDKQPVVSCEYWNSIRPYFEPSDADLRLVAVSICATHPKKAFEIACKVTKDRVKLVVPLLQQIAQNGMELALELLDSLKASDKALYNACAARVAQELLKKDSEKAYCLIDEIDDDQELLQLLPYFVLQSHETEAQLKFFNRAKSNETKAEILEQLISQISSEQGLMLIEMLVEPYCKDLALESYIIAHFEWDETAQIANMFAQIKDGDVRLNCLERLSLLVKPALLESFIKALKNPKEISHLLATIACRYGTVIDKSLISTIDQQTAFLLQCLDHFGR